MPNTLGALKNWVSSLTHRPQCLKTILHSFDEIHCIKCMLQTDIRAGKLCMHINAKPAHHIIIFNVCRHLKMILYKFTKSASNLHFWEIKLQQMTKTARWHQGQSLHFIHYYYLFVSHNITRKQWGPELKLHEWL